MGVSARIFIIEEDDSVHKLSHAAFERLIRQDPKECLSKYTGQKVRYALIAVQMKNRKPVDIFTLKSRSLISIQTADWISPIEMK